MSIPLYSSFPMILPICPCCNRSLGSMQKQIEETINENLETMELQKAKEIALNMLDIKTSCCRDLIGNCSMVYFNDGKIN